MAFVSMPQFLAILQRFDEKFKEIEDAIGTTNVCLGQLRGEQSEGLKRVVELSQKLEDRTQTSIAEIRIAGDTLYNETKRKFDELTASLHATFNEVEAKIQDVHKKNTTNVHEKLKSYLPLKNMVPKKMDNEISKWRTWRDDTLEYFDAVNIGMQAFLQGAVKCKDAEFADYIVNEAYIADKDFGSEDSAKIWRASRT